MLHRHITPAQNPQQSLRHSIPFVENMDIMEIEASAQELARAAHPMPALTSADPGEAAATDHRPHRSRMSPAKDSGSATALCNSSSTCSWCKHDVGTALSEKLPRDYRPTPGRRTSPMSSMATEQCSFVGTPRCPLPATSMRGRSIVPSSTVRQMAISRALARRRRNKA